MAPPKPSPASGRGGPPLRDRRPRILNGKPLDWTPRARSHAMPSRRQLLAASTAWLAGTRFVPRASSQTLARPARIIVGFAPGGGTDIVARLLAEALRGDYASTIIIENKPGAAARTAIEYVKN